MSTTNIIVPVHEANIVVAGIPISVKRNDHGKKLDQFRDQSQDARVREVIHPSVEEVVTFLDHLMVIERFRKTEDIQKVSDHVQ